jgi:hypothetical protein
MLLGFTETPRVLKCLGETTRERVVDDDGGHEYVLRVTRCPRCSWGRSRGFRSYPSSGFW